MYSHNDQDQLMDLYPLIGLGRYESTIGEVSNSIDLGIGMDINLMPGLSFGGRFQRAFLTNKIREVNNAETESSDLFIAQLSINF